MESCSIFYSAAPSNGSSGFCFFGLSFFLFSFDFEQFNISFAAFDLDGFNAATDFAQLFEDGQNYEVDETTLTAGDLGGVSITQKGDFHSMLFLIVSLRKELRKESICPDLRNIETSDGS